jgi:hypothetical protein
MTTAIRAVDFRPSQSGALVSASRHSTAQNLSSSQRPTLSALQVLPYCLDLDGVTLQSFGPDVHTIGWAVLEHWSDGSSIEHDHYRNEMQAVEIAQALAADSGAYVEPYPWVIAVCVADGWEVVPVDASGSQAGETWGFRRKSTYPHQTPQRNVFDAWRACLAYASAHAVS